MLSLEEMYAMPLNTTHTIHGTLSITRAVGGWVYNHYCKTPESRTAISQRSAISSVFVPEPEPIVSVDPKALEKMIETAGVKP